MMFPIAMIDSNENNNSVPLTVGIIAGLMWSPFSWIIEHWVAYFHSITRTLGVIIVWFAFPTTSLRGCLTGHCYRLHHYVYSARKQLTCIICQHLE